MIRRLRTFVLLAAVAGTLASCSTYHVDYAKAVATAEVPPNSPFGPWQGRWKSGANGHEGPLWCIIAPVPDDPKTLHFRYRAGWGKFEFGDYLHAVPTPAPKPRTLTLDGDMKLPGGFGTYAIKGTVTATTFDATFRSDGGDHGPITLRRPK